MPTQIKPKKAPLRQSTQTTAARPSAAGWFWPAPSTRITQTYTPEHRAVDIGIPVGTPIIAPRGGKILQARPDPSGYGNLVVIQTAEGQKIYLGHLNAFSVKEGQEVQPGQLLGFSGNTGRSTGPHLHYEVRTGDYSRADPLALAYAGNVKYPRPGSNMAASIPSTPGAILRTQPTAQAYPMISRTLPPPDESKRGTTDPANPFYQNPISRAMVAAGIQPPLMKLKASNLVIGVIGVLIIGVGLTGLVLGETSKVAIQPVADAIKSALQK